jgi:hypothetical protein
MMPQTSVQRPIYYQALPYWVFHPVQAPVRQYPKPVRVQMEEVAATLDEGVAMAAKGNV